MVNYFKALQAFVYASCAVGLFASFSLGCPSSSSAATIRCAAIAQVKAALIADPASFHGNSENILTSWIENSRLRAASATSSWFDLQLIEPALFTVTLSTWIARVEVNIGNCANVAAAIGPNAGSF